MVVWALGTQRCHKSSLHKIKLIKPHQIKTSAASRSIENRRTRLRAESRQALKRVIYAADVRSVNNAFSTPLPSILLYAATCSASFRSQFEVDLSTTDERGL